MQPRPRRRGRGKSAGIVVSERRPGLVDAPRKRRTTTEVRADEARAAASALQKATATEKTRSAAIARVAAKEDEMHREDEQTRLFAARPDLLTPDSPVKDLAEEQQDGDDMEQDPPASTIDTDSDGMALGTEDEHDDFPEGADDHNPFEADGDDSDHDPNYELSGGENDEVEIDADDESGSDSANEEPNTAFLAFLATQPKSAAKGKGKESAKKKLKAKGSAPKQKNLLRGEIADSRAEAPVAGSSGAKKRKAAVPMDPPPVPKRPKPSEIGGLKPGWKKIAMADERGRLQPSKKSQSRSSSKSSQIQTGTSEGEYFGGVVDEDEPVIPAADIGQPSGKRSRKAGTAACWLSSPQMGIKLADVTPEIAGPVIKVKKPRYTNDHLPFGVDRPEQIKVWQTKALGIIMHWAGSLGDAFSAGAAQPDFKLEVRKAWAKCFPDIPCDDAVYGVAASAIRTWRSETGKYAISYFDDLFAKRMEELGEDAAGRKAFVAEELHDMSFVYADPVAKRGAYRSQAVSYVYARHLRIVSVVPAEDRRKQKGALALTTAAVERALTIWKPGSKITQGVKRPGKKAAHRFVADPWATRAGTYLKVIAGLSDSKWAEINALADEWNVAPPRWDVAEDDDTSEGPDPRLGIQLSDDED